MRLAIAMAVIAALALAACQPQQIDYDLFSKKVADAIEDNPILKIRLFGSEAHLIELEKGEYNVYAVAYTRDIFDTSNSDTLGIQVTIKPVNGLWTELITAKTDGDKEVISATGHVVIEEAGFYVLFGKADDTVYSWNVTFAKR